MRHEVQVASLDLGGRFRNRMKDEGTMKPHMVSTATRSNLHSALVISHQCRLLLTANHNYLLVPRRAPRVQTRDEADLRRRQRYARPDPCSGGDGGDHFT